jgi:hypothetical protein
MNVWLKSFIIALIIVPIVFFLDLKGSSKMWATTILFMVCSVAIDFMYPNHNDETEQPYENTPEQEA